MFDYNCDLAQEYGVYKDLEQYERAKYVSSVNIPRRLTLSSSTKVFFGRTSTLRAKRIQRRKAYSLTSISFSLPSTRTVITPLFPLFQARLIQSMTLPLPSICRAVLNGGKSYLPLLWSFFSSCCFGRRYHTSVRVSGGLSACPSKRSRLLKTLSSERKTKTITRRNNF